MIKNVVLTLMQIKGISRKSILKKFKINSMSCSEEEFKDIFKIAAMNNKGIVIPTKNEISVAVDRQLEIIDLNEKNDINIVTYYDDKFPCKLRTINDPPVLLYYKGNIDSLDNKCIAIIGTREPTEHGIKVARQFGYIFGRDGYTVVSGLATGCDTFGHIGCVQSNGITAAVLAGGLDKVYPKANRELSEKILDIGGCLLSEYATGTKPFKSTFVERDRLQSGLSDGVLVIETDIKGGTMHTVQDCLDANRILACYNHPLDLLKEGKTRGNQRLIQEGKAIPIANNEDVDLFKDKMQQIVYKDKNGICSKEEQQDIFQYLNMKEVIKWE